MKTVILSILLGIPFLFGSQTMAQDPASNLVSILAEHKESRQKLIQRRQGENCYTIHLQDEDGKPVELWRSFWGRCKAGFSPNGEFLAVFDVQRMGCLSPVLVFRSKDRKLLYQTPGRFDHEESAFTYEMNEIGDDKLGISIVANKWVASSSRPDQKIVYRYEVVFASLKPIDASFYSPESIPSDLLPAEDNR